VENDKYYATFIAICPGYPMSRVVMSCSYEQLSARRIDKRYSRSIISSHRLPEYFSLRYHPISIILAWVKIIIFAKSRVTEIYAKNSFANTSFYSLYYYFKHKRISKSAKLQTFVFVIMISIVYFSQLVKQVLFLYSTYW